jgi:hypothetical protein
VGVAVDRRGDRLRLRATLPPKPNSRKRADRISSALATGLPANPAGLKEAEKRARLLGAQLAAREFTGRIGATRKPSSGAPVGSGLKRTKPTTWGRGEPLTTWERDYAKPLGKLPTQATLSAELLETLVRATRANTSQPPAGGDGSGGAG